MVHVPGGFHYQSQEEAPLKAQTPSLGAGAVQFPQSHDHDPLGLCADLHRRYAHIKHILLLWHMQRKTDDVCGSPRFLKPFKVTVVAIHWMSCSLLSCQPYNTSSFSLGIQLLRTTRLALVHMSAAMAFISLSLKVVAKF
ncbi:hypothetical protein EYF80_006456 [Liparis tanakae]|uniref:Uncharacterized protein n=1 Tax=Liparis tanakae TaxID=230148 RepID=A0A4Z2IZL3_9TELE|nr:hypothetical protein EYF80_006456 [Liparis tanakae]